MDLVLYNKDIHGLNNIKYQNTYKIDDKSINTTKESITRGLNPFENREAIFLNIFNMYENIIDDQVILGLIDPKNYFIYSEETPSYFIDKIEWSWLIRNKNDFKMFLSSKNKSLISNLIIINKMFLNDVIDMKNKAQNVNFVDFSHEEINITKYIT